MTKTTIKPDWASEASKVLDAMDAENADHEARKRFYRDGGPGRAKQFIAELDALRKRAERHVTV